jgi:hypothetical protein
VGEGKGVGEGCKVAGWLGEEEEVSVDVGGEIREPENKREREGRGEVGIVASLSLCGLVSGCG